MFSTHSLLDILFSSIFLELFFLLMLLALILAIESKNYLSFLVNQNLGDQPPNPFLSSKKVCVYIILNPQEDKHEHALQLPERAQSSGRPSGPLPVSWSRIETTCHICSLGHFWSWGITGNFYLEAAVYLSPVSIYSAPASCLCVCLLYKLYKSSLFT